MQAEINGCEGYLYFGWHCSLGLGVAAPPVLASTLPKTLIVCIFSEIGISEWPGRAVMYKSGSGERLPVKTIARYGHCQIFFLKF
jgi:hypothetical protein